MTSGQVRRLRQALDQLRLAVDYVMTAADPVLAELEAKLVREEEITQEAKADGLGHRWNVAVASRHTCERCGLLRRGGGTGYVYSRNGVDWAPLGARPLRCTGR